MALGANRGNIFASTMIRGFVLAMAGIVLGVFATLAAGRVISGYLYGVKSYDHVTFLVASSVLVLVALLASLFPAYHAASIEPMQALRTE